MDPNQPPPQGYGNQPPNGGQQPPTGYGDQSSYGNQPPPGYGNQSPYGGQPPQPPQPPQPGYGGQAPYGAPPPEKGGKAGKIVLGVVVALGLVAAGVFVPRLLSDDDADVALAGEGLEVFLEPAEDMGEDPFSDAPLSPPPDPAFAKPPAPTISVVDPPAQAVSSNRGGEPGLYGGTRDSASCDAAQLVAFLQANPEKAAAWVGALNADPELSWPAGSLAVGDIGAYVETLTPILLARDTRVTNHGFRNGTANRIQSVLQRGTAVLVDDKGVPRVKCACGNPLVPPQAAEPRYRGRVWPDFDPAVIIVVQPAPVVINNFILVDINTGVPFQRPAGPDGHQNDTDAPPGTTIPSIPGLPTPPPVVASAAPTATPAPTLSRSSRPLLFSMVSRSTASPLRRKA